MDSAIEISIYKGTIEELMNDKINKQSMQQLNHQFVKIHYNSLIDIPIGPTINSKINNSIGNWTISKSGNETTIYSNITLSTNHSRIMDCLLETLSKEIVRHYIDQFIVTSNAKHTTVRIYSPIQPNNQLQNLERINDLNNRQTKTWMKVSEPIDKLTSHTVLKRFFELFETSTNGMKRIWSQPFVWKLSQQEKQFKIKHQLKSQSIQES